MVGVKVGNDVLVMVGDMVGVGLMVKVADGRDVLVSVGVCVDFDLVKRVYAITNTTNPPMQKTINTRLSSKILIFLVSSGLAHIGKTNRSTSRRKPTGQIPPLRRWLLLKPAPTCSPAWVTRAASPPSAETDAVGKLEPYTTRGWGDSDPL
jgi:hypothetical protein